MHATCVQTAISTTQVSHFSSLSSFHSLFFPREASLCCSIAVYSPVTDFDLNVSPHVYASVLLNIILLDQYIPHALSYATLPYSALPCHSLPFTHKCIQIYAHTYTCTYMHTRTDIDDSIHFIPYTVTTV